MIKNENKLSYILMIADFIHQVQINGHIKNKLDDIKTLTYVIKSFHMYLLNLKSSKNEKFFE